MSKCIQMPSVLGSDSKRLLEEGMPSHYVLDQLLISRTSFIAGRPTAIHEL